jgi:hypothetical protein
MSKMTFPTARLLVAPENKPGLWLKFLFSAGRTIRFINYPPLPAVWFRLFLFRAAAGPGRQRGAHNRPIVHPSALLSATGKPF